MLNVELSPKPEANEPLDTRFTAIGASYDTTSDAGITLRPKDSIVHMFKSTVKEARSLRGKLIPLHTAKRWMGLAQFLQQFVDYGRFYLNSGYLAIKASAHIHTRTPKVYI